MAFRIAVAQVASLRGDIGANVAVHEYAMTAAIERDVAVLVFPELSLTGYEPDLAASLAITPTDARLGPLVDVARRHNIEAVVGAPLLSGADMPMIGAIVVTGRGMARAYHKMHLGNVEHEFFRPGCEPFVLHSPAHKVGLGICADSSRVTHPETYAARFRMLTMMANHGASIGACKSAGRSAIWSPDGSLLVQAAGTESALLIASPVDGDWQAELVAL